MSAVQAAAEDDEVIAAYFTSWGIYDRNYHVTNLPAHLLTHVNYAFAKPEYYSDSNTAALVLIDSWADVEVEYPGDTNGQAFKGNFNQLVKLKERFPHIKTLISAGGWTESDDFSDICASGNARTAFVNSCAAFITNYVFDGIDFDWEYPVEGGEDGLTHRPDDDDNYLLLVQEMRARLDVLESSNGRAYFLTIAAPVGTSSLTNRFRLGDMSASLDWINVMTYDCTGPWDAKTGHNAPLYGITSAPNPELNIHMTVQTYISNSVPADKIVVGLPFYGKGFKDVPTNAHGLFQTHGGASDEGSWEAGSFDFKDLRDGTRTNQFINANGFVRYWDAASMVPYLYNPTSHIFITYDDVESISHKVAYVVTNGLGGVMFWSVDADTADALLERTIHSACYPVHAEVPAENFRLSWFAWTGSCYAVDFCTDLVSGPWTNCPTLADTSGVAFVSRTGAHARVTAVDTNTAARSQGFYRLKLTL
ncbi:MAG: glycoside hydrolase family 18 protein [Kiritimatiellae bacterium]|nr:glycoside hydrolase family 18 protein [Kiritimatiellia bacterium]